MSLLSPSGSVDTLKSVVGKTSLELSILLMIFPTTTIDTSSKSITGDTPVLLDEILNQLKEIFEMTSHSVRLSEMLMFVLSKSVFSFKIISSLSVSSFENDVSVPEGLVPEVEPNCISILVSVSSNV